MTKILVERWQKLAGILKEGEVISLKKFKAEKEKRDAQTDLLVSVDGQIISDPDEWLFVKTDHEEQYNALVDGNIKKAEDLGARFFEVGPTHLIESYSTKRNVELSERTTPEASQDIAAYFGTNDSVDGPYKKVSDVQPFEDDKHKKEFLKKIHAEGTIREGKYPASATEYAEQLNDKSSSGFKLVTDPEHWDSVGVHTGEDLARYLAIEAHQNAYKEAHGIRPRHMNYDKYSIDEIENMVDQLYAEMEDEEDSYRDYDEEEYQAQQDELHKDDDERDDWDKEYDKWEDLEIEWDK